MKSEFMPEKDLPDNERERLEQMLAAQEKLASLGTMVAGIAHDLKNPLNFIHNFSELSLELLDELKQAVDAEERAELTDMIRQNLVKVIRHSQRAENIVRSILDQSRNDRGHQEPTDINRLCEEFMDLAFQSAKAGNNGFNCTITKAFDPELPQVHIVVQDISRVILNLLNNAFYAVRERPDPMVRITTGRNGDDVVIQIYDNGTGIPDGVLAHIFEPFYTTKPASQGTGLGLSLSRELIMANGGDITVNTEADHFTEFTIRIPVNSNRDSI